MEEQSMAERCEPLVPHVRPWAEEANDHNRKIEEYLQNCLFRGCAPRSTVASRASVLKSIFRRVEINDTRCTEGKRHLVAWELLNPKTGPGYLSEIINSLLKDAVAPGTRRKYMSELRWFCEYVMAKPHVPGQPQLTLGEKYGEIALTLTKYDLPIHAADRPVRKRYALSLEAKIAFIEFLRTHYLPAQALPHIGARDYTIIVLQVEIGARASEVLGVRSSGASCDIDRVCGRIRLLGKGSHYSGKRPRWVRLSPFAAQVLNAYERIFRPMFAESHRSDSLFLGDCGPMNPKEYWKRFRKIIELAHAAGVLVPEDLVPHDLRRTYATIELAKNPLHYRKVLKQLGHSCPSSATPYLICTDDDVAEEQDDLLDIFLDPGVDTVR